MASWLKNLVKHWRKTTRRSDLDDLLRRLADLENRAQREWGPEPGGRAGDDFYFSFEKRFRGSSEAIRSRLAVYLPRLNALREALLPGDFLDLGCGRGEWLELLREQGIPARGVDSNASMVAEARARGVKAETADLLPHLRSLPDSFLSGISAFHVAEHLPVPTLKEMLASARRVLVPGGLIILETPNPENPIVGGCDFWIDPTHRRPLPPALLTHLVASFGFGQVECLRVPSGAPEFPEGDGVMNDAALRSLAERMRIERDYAIIAVKVG
jgi:SAM-dependent methyltransferase